MDWLTKLLEGKSARGLMPAADLAMIRQDIDRLDTVQAGLASQVLRYIVSGENDSVLLTLNQHQAKLAPALRTSQFGGWSSAGGWCAGRANYILTAAEWRPAVLRRYGQVLAIVRAGNTWPKLPGTERSPQWFRTLLYEHGEAWEALKHKNQTSIHGKPDITQAPPFTVAKLADMLAEDGTLLPILEIEIARAIAAICGEPGAALLRELLAGEKNDSVAAELRRLLGNESTTRPRQGNRTDGPEGYIAMDGSWIDAPTVQPLPADVPVSPALRALFEEGFAAWRVVDERYNREQRGQKYFRERQVLPGDATRRLCALLGPGGEKLQREASDRLFLGLLSSWRHEKDIAAVMARIAACQDLTLWHLHRAAQANPKPELAAFGGYTWAAAIRPRAQALGGLVPLAQLVGALGWRPDALMRTLLERHYWDVPLHDWEPDQIWPYFACHFGLLDEALGLAPPSAQMPLSESRALEMLPVFPKTPARYFNALIELAIGDRVTVRDPARALLAGAAGVDAILLPLLKHPKQETRIGAANWLAERGATAALPDLLAAAKAEKLPSPKAALIGAIARLGGDIKPFVSASALVVEATEGLKKIPGKDLAWFPFTALPALSLADGAPLDPIVPRWWLALASKLKQPGGSPWFELLLDQLAPASAAKLGSFVLHAWIAFDTAAPSEAEANAHAQANVQSTLASWIRWQPNATHDSIFAMLRAQKLGEYFNSGNDSKGILALSVRAPGSEAVAVTRAFFRDHYPRTAQCKALLECLAGNPSPVATQYVLAIAKRWRTRTVQETASELVQQIAAKRGWTAEELADRTIPTAGFDDSGVLTLPLGERAYTVRLDARDQFVLFNPDGKQVQSLPSGDQHTGLAEAKTTLSAARKEAKQVFEFQAKRLYEALCVERVWPAGEWQEFLLRHPLMGRLVQRLLWAGLDAAGSTLAFFRPMEDFSLTDAADEPVDPARFNTIRLAHRTGMEASQAAAWSAHFKDYGITPLFDQLTRPPLALSDALREAGEITDRRGWMIQAFKLRTAATKLGYTRGAAEDGGVFMTYEKSFEALQLNALVEFTGNALPEEDRLTALTGLSFRRMGRRAAPAMLKDVPAVLLSEVWNDFHDIAAAGTGFDAEWEKKGGW
jgi:hypothetical protein